MIIDLTSELRDIAADKVAVAPDPITILRPSSKPITERRTFAPVDKWIVSAASPTAKQWIGDALRATSRKRDENTVSDKMMMLRHLVGEPMVCTRATGRVDEETGEAIPDAWVPSKTLAAANAEFAHTPEHQRPMNRKTRRRMFGAPIKMPVAREALSKEQRRLERCWRKADKRRANNSKSN